MIQVTKRNGSKEPLNIEKIHRVLEWATEGLNNVSISEIEMNANLSFFDGISTNDIHTILIHSANDLVSEEHLNYDKVAARLLLYHLRKNVWGDHEPPRLYDFIIKNSSIYDEVLLSKYTESEIHKIGKLIKHNRDNNFTYAGLRQFIDKYLLKDKLNNVLFETPQFSFILMAMTIFAESPDRLHYIRKAYDYFSTFKINIPTPILCGLRSKIKQYASCILVDCDDDLDSIFASNSTIGMYTAKRAGIGLNVGRIRPINSPIRNGEVVHTGIIPYLKMFESTVKTTSQNGVRGGCFEKTQCVEILDKVEIDGQLYDLSDKIIIDGQSCSVSELLLKLAPNEYNYCDSLLEK